MRLRSLVNVLDDIGPSLDWGLMIMEEVRTECWSTPRFWDYVISWLSQKSFTIQGLFQTKHIQRSALYGDLLLSIPLKRGQLFYQKKSMEIFNRPPSIAEDTLHYTLRPQPSQSSKPVVTSLAALIHAYAQQLLPNFIWHRDPFELKTVQDAGNRHNRQGDDSGWYLEGRMRVGDSVDDEWCVVWLLWEVSSRWDIAIR